MSDNSAYALFAFASGDATVTVEVEGSPVESPPGDPPPDLVDTGLSLPLLLVAAVALTAAGLLIRRWTDRFEEGERP